MDNQITTILGHHIPHPARVISVKLHIAKTFEKSLLKIEETYTSSPQIEACLNNMNILICMLTDTDYQCKSEQDRLIRLATIKMNNSFAGQRQILKRICKTTRTNTVISVNEVF